MLPDVTFISYRAMMLLVEAGTLGIHMANGVLPVFSPSIQHNRLVSNCLQYNRFGDKKVDQHDE